jgi:uncharacterized Zn finger protein
MAYSKWPKYVSVAKRRENAQKQMAKLKKQGKIIQPVTIEGRTIAHTFWGKQWCNHLEQFSDYENRLPRGRTYVRNGSVCHLEINKGNIKAIVAGSSLYEINVSIKPLSKDHWKKIQQQCAGKVGSLLELMQGRLSKAVMKIVCDPKTGLFPLEKDIQLACNCPDWAQLCKHLAAVLYAVGARLDTHPEDLFLLRDVDHKKLITELAIPPKTTNSRRKPKGNMADVFGINFEDNTTAASKKVTKPRQLKRTTKTKTLKKTKNIRPSGKTIIRLRKKFNMNKSQFAKLAGVSAPTITNWESNPERLTLRSQTLGALSNIVDLSREEAWAQLSKQ